MRSRICKVNDARNYVKTGDWPIPLRAVASRSFHGNPKIIRVARRPCCAAPGQRRFHTRSLRSVGCRAARHSSWLLLAHGGVDLIGK